MDTSFVEGHNVASVDRNKHTNVSLHGLNDIATAKGHLTLDILVEAIGRDNSGSKFDLKGLMSSHVYLNGRRHLTESSFVLLPCIVCADLVFQSTF